MAQSGFTPIQLYYSTTSGNQPIAGNLANGELALNTNDGILYYKDSSGVVQVLASGSSVSVLAATVATTTNLASLSGLLTIDGVTVVAGDRVLVKDQSASQNNGVYVAAVGAWSRSIDCNSSAEIAGRIISVRSGTLNGGEQWATTFKSTDTLGTTGMAWYQVALQNTAVTFAAGTVITGTDNTNAALRITQLGTGNALLVEDSANPDSTPFVIDASGNVVVGGTTPITGSSSFIPPLQVSTGNTNNSGVGVNSFSAGTGSGALNFNRSKSSTIGTNTVLTSGDTIGGILFAGADGTAFIRAASITASVDGDPGTNDMPGRLVFSTTADGASTVTEAMRISSGQLVSIGTAQNAQSKLYVTNTVTDTANAEQGIYTILTANNASGSNIKIGNRSSVTTGASFAGTNILNAFRGDITYSLASAYTGSLQGFRTSIGNSGAGAVSAIYGFTSTAPSNTGGGSITNFYGFAQDDVTTATAVYGYLGSVTSGSGKWNLYMSGTAANYMNGKTRVGTSATPTVSFEIGATDAILIPKGTTAEQPTGVAGYLRFNTSTTQFEGYNGTAWSSVGGATISNDTSTASNLYPLFAGATSGTATTLYTGNAKLLYKPSTGELTSSVLTAGNGIVVNSQTVSTSYTIAAGYSGMSAGPVTVASGQSVTVSSGSRWVIQ